MDTSDKLAAWLQKMAYDGRMPDNMKPFCSTSTAFIWEQLIATVKPRQEVERIRNNLLIRRLLKDGRACSSPTVSMIKRAAQYPLKEVELWNCKRKLQKQVEAAQYRIYDLNGKLDRLNTNNKKNYLYLENIRQKIEETRKFVFLLEAKSKKLETDAGIAQEMLAQVHNLTPVESDEQNRNEVSERLKRCSEKLEMMIQEQDETVAKHDGANSSLGLLSDFSIIFDDIVPAASSSKNHNFSKASICQDLIASGDQQLNRLVDETLHRNNRLVIWNLLMELCQTSKLELLDLFADSVPNHSDVANCINIKSNNEMLMNLYAIHVNYELKAAEVGMKIRMLQQELSCIRKNTAHKLASDIDSNQLQSYLQLQQKYVGLSAMVQHLEEIVNTMRRSLGAHTDIETYQNESRAVEETIASKLLSIEYKLNTFKQTYDSMTQYRSETFLLARKLNQFTVDTKWTLPLSSNSSSIEIGTFLEFPLEYNRIVTDSNAKRFLRDLPLNYIPYQEQLNSNLVHMLVILLQNPCAPAESILFEILKTKIKTEQLKAMRCIPESFQCKDILGELQNQESLIKCTLDNIKSLVCRNSSSSDILASIKTIVNLWLEMPLKHFVSPNRLFNGFPYSYYDSVFTDLYKQL